MNVAAASTTIPVTNAAIKEYARISLRTLAIVTLPIGFPYSRRHLHSRTVSDLRVTQKDLQL